MSHRAKKDHPDPADEASASVTMMASSDYDGPADEDQEINELAYDETLQPLAPTGLRVVNSNIGQVRLTWHKSQYATGYKVYRGASANPTSLVATLADVGVLFQYVADGTYRYRVKATATQDSDYSQDVQIVVATA